MEFLKLGGRRKSFVSEAVYVALNIALAVGLMLIVLYTGSPWVALLLALLSKWRVFAVRPRYWWANFQSNLIDFIVSVSVVVHLMVINDSALVESYKLVLMAILTGLYVGWLVYLKPKSSRRLVALQAGVATASGAWALFAVSFAWPVSAVVLCMWLLGYTSAKHVLNAYDDEAHTTFLSLAWGFVLASIGWVAYHWTVAYMMPVFTAVQVPQVVITTTLLSFLTYKVYDSHYRNDRVKSSDIILPLLLTVSIIAILLLIFNRVGSAI